MASPSGRFRGSYCSWAAALWTPIGACLWPCAIASLSTPKPGPQSGLVAVGLLMTNLLYLQRKVKQQNAPFLQRAYTPLFYSGCVFHLRLTNCFVRLR